MKTNFFPLILSLAVLILWSCGDDEVAADGPTLTTAVNSFSVKPDSSVSFDLDINAPNLFQSQSLTIQNSGNGIAEITSVEGSGSTTGTASISFTAGSAENESVTLTITLIDDEMLEGSITINIEKLDTL